MIEAIKMFFNIRDEIIPNKNTEYFEKYLYRNHIITSANIEELYGAAIYHDEIRAVALLNLYVREHNIKINKRSVIENIFWAYAREKYNKGLELGYRSEFVYCKQVESKYYERYYDIFQ